MANKKQESQKSNFLKFFIFTLGLLILLAGIAFKILAHGVYLFAWVEGETVYTESSFGGKSPETESVR